MTFVAACKNMNRIFDINVKIWIGKKYNKLFFLINKNTIETLNDYKKFLNIIYKIKKNTFLQNKNV